MPNFLAFDGNACFLFKFGDNRLHALAMRTFGSVKVYEVGHETSIPVTAPAANYPRRENWADRARYAIVMPRMIIIVVAGYFYTYYDGRLFVFLQKKSPRVGAFQRELFCDARHASDLA